MNGGTPPKGEGVSPRMSGKCLRSPTRRNSASSWAGECQFVAQLPLEQSVRACARPPLVMTTGDPGSKRVAHRAARGRAEPGAARRPAQGGRLAPGSKPSPLASRPSPARAGARRALLDSPADGGEHSLGRIALAQGPGVRFTDVRRFCFVLQSSHLFFRKYR